jgi:ArsR family transcriptional regulator
MSNEEMLDFVKALAHADRLRIIGLLTQRRAGVQEIAGELDLPFRDAANHMAFMQFAGIVREADGLYELDSNGLALIARSQFAGQPRDTYTPAPDLGADARKVLSTFLNADGSIRQIPPQAARLQVILDYIIEAFAPGANYTEKEVNLIIARFHADVSGLRRDLVDHGMLQRKPDGSRYWRPAGGAE